MALGSQVWSERSWETALTCEMRLDGDEQRRIWGLDISVEIRGIVSFTHA